MKKIIWIKKSLLPVDTGNFIFVWWGKMDIC